MKVKKVSDCISLMVKADGTKPDGLRRTCKEFNREDPNCTNACPLYKPEFVIGESTQEAEQNEELNKPVRCQWVSCNEISTELGHISLPGGSAVKVWLCKKHYEQIKQTHDEAKSRFLMLRRVFLLNKDGTYTDSQVLHFLAGYCQFAPATEEEAKLLQGGK